MKLRLLFLRGFRGKICVCSWLLKRSAQIFDLLLSVRLKPSYHYLWRTPLSATVVVAATCTHACRTGSCGCISEYLADTQLSLKYRPTHMVIILVRLDVLPEILDSARLTEMSEEEKHHTTVTLHYYQAL